MIAHAHIPVVRSVVGLTGAAVLAAVCMTGAVGPARADTHQVQTAFLSARPS